MEIEIEQCLVDKMVSFLTKKSLEFEMSGKSTLEKPLYINYGAEFLRAFCEENNMTTNGKR